MIFEFALKVKFQTEFDSFFALFTVMSRYI